MNQSLTQRGFTFVEMMVVIAVFTVLSLAVMNSIATFYRFNAYSIAQSAEVEQARQGVELMIRDIREMTFADDGSFPLITKDEYEIAFYSDIDRDDSVELVEYVLTGTVLEKRVYDAVDATYDTTTPDATFLISDFVQNNLETTPIFNYYDASGTEMLPGDPVTDARYVEMNVIVNVDPVRNPGEYALRSSAALRNLLD
jgi:prepilin-type N-terminal cleavage/methylation domain